MRCRACNSCNTRVTSTDRLDDLVTKRYCRCLDCKTKFRTVERYEVAKPIPLEPCAMHGSNNPKSKLNPMQIQTIRQLHQQGYSNGQIAIKVQVNSSTICRIVNYKTYKNV
jgi:transcriptional regulator NrdR family protein